MEQQEVEVCLTQTHTHLIFHTMIYSECLRHICKCIYAYTHTDIHTLTFFLMHPLSSPPVARATPTNVKSKVHVTRTSAEWGGTAHRSQQHSAHLNPPLTALNNHPVNLSSVFLYIMLPQTNNKNVLLHETICCHYSYVIYTIYSCLIL